MADNESTIKVKLWHILVAIFTIITFVFTFYVAIQKDVNARQDVDIKERLSTSTFVGFKEQYYRDITNIDKQLTIITKEIKRFIRRDSSHTRPSGP